MINKKRALINLLAVLMLLLAQACSASKPPASEADQDETPILIVEAPAQVDESNPLSSQGVSKPEWQAMQAEIESDYHSTYLKASNTDAGDRFGASVAISGDTIVIGAWEESGGAAGVNGDQSDNSTFGAGAAYVFVREGDGGWQQQAYLKASNPDLSDGFGWSVAISGDTIVVGAYLEGSGASGVNGDQSDNSAIGAGAAYVFVRGSQGIWSQQAYLKASNTDAQDWFGYSVAISGDMILVGAPYEDSPMTSANENEHDTASSNCGTAYVFVRDDQGNWSQQALLKASSTEPVFMFGRSLAISGDMLVIGEAGAAYVFEPDGQGGWQLQAKLKASETDADDRFGWSVAISDDTVVIGASYENSSATGVNGDQRDKSASRAGAAYVFVRDGQGIWSQQAYLKASNTDADDLFGHSVAISGDKIVIGAIHEASRAVGVNGDQQDNSASRAGAAYIFVRDAQGYWIQQAYLKASNTAARFFFGSSLAVFGNTVVIGASSENSNVTGVNGNQQDTSANDSGAVYVFEQLEDLPSD